MTSDQTNQDDEITKKRTIVTLTDAMTDGVVQAATSIGGLRRQGITNRETARSLIQGLARVYPKEAGALDDEAFVDSIAALLELFVIMTIPARASELPAHLISVMEGDALFAGVAAKMESAMDRLKERLAEPVPTMVPTGDPISGWAPSTFNPMWILIQRLFKSNPSPLPDQAPALQCHLVLRGMAHAISGVLSETPEGTLRMLSPAGPADRGKPLTMVEQFFAYEDVLTIALECQVAPEVSRIVRS
jgi:hypothetical protein